MFKTRSNEPQYAKSWDKETKTTNVYGDSIETVTKNDIVLDPFSGSGTTVYVAKKYHRKWIGIEQDKNYIQISKNRLQKK